jgi:hypothetical protein
MASIRPTVKPSGSPRKGINNITKASATKIIAVEATNKLKGLGLKIVYDLLSSR